MSDWKTFSVPAALVLSTSAPCFATVYFTADQAQKAIFPGASCTPWAGKLTDAQKKAIEKASDLRIRKDPQIWRVSSGGWFIVDEVSRSSTFAEETRHVVRLKVGFNF